MRELLLEQEVLVRGLDDWIYLAEIISIAKRQMLLPDASAIDRSIDALSCLLACGLVEAGMAVRAAGWTPKRPITEFRAWGTAREETIRRIREEIKRLDGRLPSIGEVCWIRNTDAGNAAARVLDEQDSSGS
jgi:hypothetical protein